MTPIPPGTALRLLLIAWINEDMPHLLGLHGAWLFERLRVRGAVLAPLQYAILAPRFEAWGECHGIDDVIARAAEDAAVLTTEPQETR